MRRGTLGKRLPTFPRTNSARKLVCGPPQNLTPALIWCQADSRIRRTSTVISSAKARA